MRGSPGWNGFVFCEGAHMAVAVTETIPGFGDGTDSQGSVQLISLPQLSSLGMQGAVDISIYGPGNTLDGGFMTNVLVATTTQGRSGGDGTEAVVQTYCDVSGSSAGMRGKADIGKTTLHSVFMINTRRAYTGHVSLEA